MSKQMRAIVHKILAQKNDWVLCILKDDKNNEYRCTCVPADFEIGETIKATIEETNHPKYGLGYKIVSYAPETPESKNGIIRYLSSGLISNVGPETAERIYKHFGKDTLSVIRKTPERLLEVDGIGEKRLSAITGSLQESEKLMGLYQISNGVITKSEANKIRERYGDKAEKVMQTNPYQLIRDISGFGFLKADRIAKGCGVSEFSIQRMKAAIVYTLEQIAETNGDCYVTEETMQKEAMAVLNRFPKALVRGRFESSAKKYAEEFVLYILDSADASRVMEMHDEEVRLYVKNIKAENEVIKKCMKSGKVTEGEEDLLTNWIADYLSYTMRLADALQQCLDDGSVILEDEKLSAKSVYDTEKAIAEVVKSMIQGRDQMLPAVIDSFIEGYEAEHNIQLAAEQKNAVHAAINNRLSIITGGPGCGKTTNIQTIVAAWQHFMGGKVLLMAPTGRASQRIREKMQLPGTITATIHKMTGVNGGSSLYEPKEDTLIICDEASMIDVSLAKILMDFSKNSTLVLVGDADQLPPVGSGNFFKDLIRSRKVPTTRLVLGFRNTGLIAKNADLVNHGNTKEIRTGSDFHVSFMEREDMADQICKEYMSALHAGVDKKDMCILTLQKTRGAVCTKVLNEKLQDMCNPSSKGAYRVGDRVMQIKNDYEMEYTQDGKRGKGVFNGDVGIVIGIGDGEVDVAFDDGRICRYSQDNIMNLILAYAITVHKSQGSEYKKVWIAVSMDQYVMLSRAIIYTAVTRASNEETIICEKNAFQKAVRTVGSSNRNTRLIDFLARA